VKKRTTGRSCADWKLSSGCAAGSLAELETHLLVAERLRYTDHPAGSSREAQCTWKNRSNANIHAAPTKTNTAMRAPVS
jgi:hypothetical protein